VSACISFELWVTNALRYWELFDESSPGVGLEDEAVVIFARAQAGTIVLLRHLVAAGEGVDLEVGRRHNAAR